MQWQKGGCPCRERGRFMDRTLTGKRTRNRKRVQRNHGAWRRFSLDGKRCPYCPHDGSLHLVQSAQPHFYRRATADEERNPSTRLYRYRVPSGDQVLVRRMTVARNAEIVAAYCTACAEGMRTSQVVCYQRNVAVGEVVGMRMNNHRKIGSTA